MGLPRWFRAFANSRRATTLISLISTFAGVGLLLDRPKGTILEWLSLPLIVFGGALITWAIWPARYTSSDSSPSLSTRLLRRLTLDGRLVPLFPGFGAGLIVADIAYNWALSPTPAFQTEDIMVLLGAASLLGYGFVPVQFTRERDFVLLFFLWLNAILVVPLLLARLYYSDFERSVDLYSWVALAPETSAVLNALGVNNQVHAVVGSTAPGLTFTPQHVGIQVTVVITTSCSGIYSFGIFAAAFIAFVLTEYEKPSLRVWFLLGLGLTTAYVANVLRMVIIVLVGFYTDTNQTELQNMLLAHSYAGWLIFLGWLALFWGPLLKYAPPEPSLSKSQERNARARQMEARCAACGDILGPTIPATRCTCRAMYHVACAVLGSGCVRCQRPIDTTRVQTSIGDRI